VNFRKDVAAYQHKCRGISPTIPVSQEGIILQNVSRPRRSCCISPVRLSWEAVALVCRVNTIHLTGSY
jgi:hypothetical protein